MALVVFERKYQGCRRTRNGAWVPSFAQSCETSFAIDESRIRDYALGSANGTIITVTWPDGHEAQGVVEIGHVSTLDKRLAACVA